MGFETVQTRKSSRGGAVRRLPTVLPHHVVHYDKEHREGVEVAHHHVIRRLLRAPSCVHDARERVGGLFRRVLQLCHGTKPLEIDLPIG